MYTWCVRFRCSNIFTLCRCLIRPNHPMSQWGKMGCSTGDQKIHSSSWYVGFFPTNMILSVRNFTNWWVNTYLECPKWNETWERSWGTMMSHLPLFIKLWPVSFNHGFAMCSRWLVMSICLLFPSLLLIMFYTATFGYTWWYIHIYHIHALILV